MGGALSSNVDNMMTSVVNDSTETTNIVNTNKNNSAQAASLDGCTLIADGSVTLKNSLKQSQNIMQQSTVSNSMVDSNTVNQSLLQSAQSKVSNWGIGFSSARNTANQVASVSNSTNSAINNTNSNINNAFNSINCTDSTIIAGNNITMENDSDQTLIANQVTTATAYTDITNNIKQAASQKAVATVSGMNLIGMIIAVIVLIIIVSIALRALKGKASKSSSSGSSLKGGGIYMLSGTELSLYCWCAVAIIILATMGGIGLQQREILRCDYDSQCQSDSFWFNAKSTTCSCHGRDSCSTNVDQKSLPELVPPPLFMCNAVQPDVGFGSGAEFVGLYPGSLQYMMVQKVIGTSEAENQMRNNNGFNCGVFSQLLNMAENGITGSDNIVPFIQALVAYFQRQIVTIGPDGKSLINTPDLSTSLNNWCAARIVQNLLPIQPSFAAPDPGYLCTWATTGECANDPSKEKCCDGSTPTDGNCPEKTSTLRSASSQNRIRLVRNAANGKTRRSRKRKGRVPLTDVMHSVRTSRIRLAAGLGKAMKMKRTKQLEQRVRNHRDVARRMFPSKKPNKARLAGSVLGRRSRMKGMRQRKRPGKASLISTPDCSLSGGGSGSVKYSTPAFSSQGNNNPSGFNLFADVCYKSTGDTTRPFVFRTPTTCPTSTCSAYPTDGTSMVVGVRIASAGSNYSTGTTCTIQNGGGSNATATVHVGDSTDAAGNTVTGAILGITIVNGGSGFTSQPDVVLLKSTRGSGTGADLVAVLGTMCMAKDDTSKQCTERCGDGTDGWMAMRRMQGQSLGSGTACQDAGANAATNPSTFYKNGLYTKSKDNGSVSETKCYVGAGTYDGGYNQDSNQNLIYDQECNTTQINVSSSAGNSKCQFRAIDNELKQNVPVWMANYTTYMANGVPKPITVGIALGEADTGKEFYANLNDEAASYAGGTGESAALNSQTCGTASGHGCIGEWGQGQLTSGSTDVTSWTDNNPNQGIPDQVLQGSLGLSNPFCNAIAGLCQDKDTSRADYDPDCSAERQINYINDNLDKYSSTCAQQPIGGCGLYYTGSGSDPVSSAAHICSSSSKAKCWSRGLCQAVGGIWTLDAGNGGFYCSDQPACPNTTLYNSDSMGGECLSCADSKDCTATTYINDECDDICKGITKDQATCTGSSANFGPNAEGKQTSEGNICKCAWTNGACTSTIPFPKATGCEWSAKVNGCIMGCAPKDNICDNCTQAKKDATTGEVSGCVAPCTWDGQVISVLMTNSGSGYTAGKTTATISAPPPPASGEALGSTAKVTVNVTAGIVESIAVTKGGANYQNAPTIVISEGNGGKGAGFAGTVNVVNGVVKSIKITKNGSNYGLTGSVTVSLSGTKGVGFKGIVHYTNHLVSDGEIQSIKVVNGGSGYGPIVSIGGPGSKAEAVAVVSGGVIQSINMIHNGQDYSSVPYVQIKSMTGSGATATPTVASGAILGVTITNSGSGYPGTVDAASVDPKVKITFSDDGKGAAGSVVTQGSCFLGVNMCDPKSIGQELSDLFLVRIPGSFMADSAATMSADDMNDTVNFGCLPNVFIPDIANTNNQLFLGNCMASYRNKFTKPRTCCQASTKGSIPSTFSTQDVYLTTCVSGDGSSNPTLADNYVCGCLDVSSGGSCYGDGEKPINNAYDKSDMICYVNLNKTSNQGGFILREASTITSTSTENDKVNTLYGVSESSPNPDLYNYVAEPSTNVVTWEQMNTTTVQRDRLYMFVRMLYWLILTSGTKEETLSQLGLSCFVNNLGYDSGSMQPNTLITDKGIDGASMYSTQPLLVWDIDGSTQTPRFFTLQELKEGMVDASMGIVSSKRTPVPNARKYLKQITMWCYSAEDLGVSSLVSSEGFNVAVADKGTDSSLQLSAADNLKGLMYGSTGYCLTFWVTDQWIGSTLGIACVIFAILTSYAVYKNVKYNQK